jgi:hypothetical protein
MRKIAFIFMLIVAAGLNAACAFASIVTATSVSSAVYEDGEFTPSDSGFTAKYDIDEEDGVIRLEKIIENNREGRIEEGASYEITNVVVSEGISALLVSKKKKGQKIITAVREADLGASEIIVFGDDFYEYCCASNGKFYLEYGKVSRGLK